jgi:predicted phage terminase large subunit-like protein
MFHRYREDDLAGRLLDEGDWELLRYAMVADGDYKGFPDPMGRTEGEKLSPRFTWDFINAQMKSGFAWLGQFQGRPTAKEGAFFKVSKLEIVDAVPANLRTVRAWDMASSEGQGNYSAGVKMGTDDKGLFFVTNVKRGQWSTDTRNDTIKQTAALDGVACKVRGPQDPGAAGKDSAQTFTRLLAGYSVKTAPVSGDKVLRADPFSAQVNAGNVKLVKGDWNAAYIEELRQFPNGKNDDMVDGSADAFNELCARIELEFAIA